MSDRLSRRALVVLILTGTALALRAQAARSRTKPPVPDLTRGGQPDKSHDWTLGPTGARGWIWGWKGHTFDARQILITQVDPKSPADGVLAKGDVVLGVDGKPFHADARVQFAQAVTRAESQAGGGRLKLIRWRGGKTANIELKLAVLGSYGPRAPYDCTKSARIFDLGCRAIAAKGLDNVSIPNSLNALALLAAGKKEYAPLLAKYAKLVADFHRTDMASWHYGYANLFLAEYVLATKDASVVSGLRRITSEIARGQGNAGTWGHKFARPDGILNGYGAMNQPGLILTLSMVLARETGIRDAALDRAIARATRFLRWYVDKGAIPYGDHEPWPDHDDNGKCSVAAALYDLLGDSEAATFFARMGTAAHAERESGHTGNFFNVLWALPGVSRCGPAATGAYLKETAWYYDLARRWDGSFVYQGTPANWNGHSYSRWDSTGAYLLAYALPRKSLYITGRKPSVVKPLSQAEVAKVIDAGRGFDFWANRTAYDGKSTSDLLAALTSWSPAVRNRAAWSLGRREEDVVGRLLAMVAGKNRYARYGACQALAEIGPRAASAAPTLRGLLADEDRWLRSLAIAALARMDPPTRKAVTPDLMKVAAATDRADPRRRVSRAAGQALFVRRRGASQGGLLTESLNGVDRTLLYAAVRAILRNEDGHARSYVGAIYSKLTAEDLRVLLPDIIRATREMAPSNVMFADGVRLAGLELLAKLRIREGMKLCIELVEPSRWGFGRRAPRCLACLRSYGGNARGLIGDLRKLREAVIQRDRRKGAKAEMAVAIEKVIADIQADSRPPKLRTLDEFTRNPTKP
jgi:hypothetical protein